MNVQEISHQLQRIALDSEFPARSAELTHKWSSTGVGIEAIEPILRFMEEYPAIDFGAPGPLVHFIERFHGKGYDEKLVESVRRKPTSLTVSMLNRLINGTNASDAIQRLVTIMESVRFNPLADQVAIELANRYLERLSR
jgi:hypothetical protein